MSNAKIRSWIYRALFILILCGIAWYFLMRPSSYDSAAAKKIFEDHKGHFQDVANYLIEKNIQTDVLDFPTIDNRYGIYSEDTNEFRACNSGITALMNAEVKTIHSHNGVITFVTENSGGILLQNHVEITYVPKPDARTSLGLPLSEAHWFYEIVETKKKD